MSLLSSVSETSGASRISSSLRSLTSRIVEYEKVRVTSKECESQLRLLLDKVDGDRKLVSSTKSRLRSQYEQSVELVSREEACLRDALNEIYSIRKIRAEMRIAARNAGNKESIRRGALMKLLATSAETIPLWIGESGQAPSLCGANEADAAYVAQPGDLVAALVRSPDGDENWILAEVMSYNAAAGKYEVDDIDEEQKERHTLNKRKVIPLPTMRACPLTNPEALYAPGTTVMAIYPQTTCFYKGVIKEQPSTASDDYQVLFEDPSYADGYSPPLNVAQRYIIQVNEKKKAK